MLSLRMSPPEVCHALGQKTHGNYLMECVNRRGQNSAEELRQRAATARSEADKQRAERVAALSKADEDDTNTSAN
jgi:hypothetical protein